MKMGVVLPTTEGWSKTLDLARFAENAGADAVWVNDGHAGCHAETWTTMAALATNTARVDVGAYMLNAALRDPYLSARAVATLERLAPGRIRVILGTGWNRNDYEALHAEFPPIDERLERTKHALTVLKRETAVRIEIAGVRDEVLELAASAADGWALSADALDTYFERLDFLRRACARAGREFESLHVSCTLPGTADVGSRIADLAAHHMREFRIVVDGDDCAYAEELAAAAERSRTA